MSLFKKLAAVAKMVTGKSVTDLAIDEGAKRLRGVIAKRKAKRAAKKSTEAAREGRK
jgi:hypothetical protein